MSATNHTTTIELSQYVSTDKPTYLVDYNGDMLKIDNAIASDRDSITTAQNKADTADGKADINKTSIDNINTQLNGDPLDPGDTGLAGDVTALEGTVNTVTSLLGTGSPTTSEQTVIGAINGLEGAIAPREDSATLANSYAIGEQFARGGSVYEALVSLTAGTAFASLVLNTDYKVSDTLVEQIANAGGGAVLPEGYYLKELHKAVTVTADGIKATKELVKDLEALLVTEFAALPNGEVAHIIELEDNYLSAHAPISTGALYYTNETTRVTASFASTKAAFTGSEYGIETLSYTFFHGSNGTVARSQVFGSTATGADFGSGVPTADKTITVYYDLYSPFPTT